MSVTNYDIPAWSTELDKLDWQERLRWVAKQGLRVAFSTSFSKEDQLITHFIATEKLPIEIFTLDTGRLFEATHKLHQLTTDQYGIKIHTYFPDPLDVEAYIEESGVNGFYDSVASRKRCCHIRKVKPLARALSGVDVWISGLRQEQSANRSTMEVAGWNDDYNLATFYPLIDVRERSLNDFIQQNHVPISPLYKEGYTSIGCAPCTRAIHEGEDARAGRWWWEDKEGAQECGLHVSNGKLVRRKVAASHA